MHRRFAEGICDRARTVSQEARRAMVLSLQLIEMLSPKWAKDDMHARSLPFCLVVGVLALVALASCTTVGPEDEKKTGSGGVRVLLTDDPFPFDLVDEANVTVTHVALEGRDDGSFILSDEPQTLNLLDLQGDVTALLAADGNLESGLYEELLLKVSSASVVLKTGKRFDVQVPAGKIRVEELDGFKIVKGKEVTLTLDFLIDESFEVRGRVDTPAGIKGFRFEPVVKALGWSYEDEDDDGKGDDDGDDDDGGDELTYTGAIEAIGTGYLIVGDKRFEVNGETEFDGVDSLLDLEIGMKVEVTYIEQNDGGRLALEIEVKDEDDA